MLDSNRDENSIIQWHRLFGLAFIDYFTDTPYAVELETDVETKQHVAFNCVNSYNNLE